MTRAGSSDEQLGDFPQPTSDGTDQDWMHVVV